MRLIVLFDIIEGCYFLGKIPGMFLVNFTNFRLGSGYCLGRIFLVVDCKTTTDDFQLFWKLVQ